MPRTIVGLDLGQARDPTALVVLESDDQAWNFQCRHLERFPLNRPYPEYVQKVYDLMHLPELRSAALVIDHTGVGRVVMDMFRAVRLKPIGITITAGINSSHNSTKTEYRVPKRDIAMAGLSLLQGQRLKISRQIPEAGVLVHELLNFRVKVNLSGNDTYEAWREGDHDDLVLALCCAAWYGVNGPNVKVNPAVGGAIPILQAMESNPHALPT